MSNDPLIEGFGTSLSPDRAARLREKLSKLNRITLIPTPTSDPKEAARRDVIYGATTMEEVAEAVLRKRSQLGGAGVSLKETKVLK